MSCICGPKVECVGGLTMKFSRIRAIICVGLCALLAACSHQQEAIYNVQNKPPSPAARSLSPNQIESHINQAMVAKGWKVDKVRPGELRGTIEWSRHSAVVTVLATQQAYSIRLHSSTNLREGDGYIHRQYNVRVRALEEDIDRRLKGGSS